MNWLESIHEKYVLKSRAKKICAAITSLMRAESAANYRILDIGCGDALISLLLSREQTGTKVVGCDVMMREKTYAKVDKINGKRLPYADKSFDAALFVDVLHHTENAVILLKEAIRVSRGFIIIKDHIMRGELSLKVLRFMDRVGNERYGVSLPYDYWTKARWLKTFRLLGLGVDVWKESWLNFITRLEYRS